LIQFFGHPYFSQKWRPLGLAFSDIPVKLEHRFSTHFWNTAVNQ